MSLKTAEGWILVTQLCSLGAGPADPDGVCAVHGTWCVETYYSRRRLAHMSLWQLFRLWMRAAS